MHPYDERAQQALTADPVRRAGLMLAGYFCATTSIVLGVVTLATGLKQAIGHASETLSIVPELLLPGGGALFLAGAFSS